MNIKAATPGTAMWLCGMCGNLTEQQVNKKGCACGCRKRYGVHPQPQIYLGCSIVIEDERAFHGGYEPVETIVYRFYDIRDSTAWSAPIGGFDTHWDSADIV